MDIKEIAKALSTEFRPGDPEHFRLGVWHDGDTLENSSIKISKDLDSGDAFIDILDKKGTGMGTISDIKKHKQTFNTVRKHLPPGDYGLRADHPTKAKKYIRDFLGESGFKLSGEKGGAKVLNKKTGKLEHKSFDTLTMTVPNKNLKINKGRFVRDADGIYNITADQATDLKKQIFKDIKANKFSKKGLNLFNKVRIDGNLRDIRWKGRSGVSRDNPSKWAFDRVSQKDQALAKRVGAIKEGTLTPDEFLYRTKEMFSDLGIEKYNYKGKTYNVESFSKLKHREYKSGLNNRLKYIKTLTPEQLAALDITDVSAGHVVDPNQPDFIESRYNYVPEQGSGPGGNYGNQAKVRSKTQLEQLGLDRSRNEFIDEILTDKRNKYLFSDEQMLKTLKGAGAPLGGAKHTLKLGRNIRNNPLVKAIKPAARLNTLGKVAFGGLDAIAATEGTSGALDKSKNFVDRTADVLDAISGISGLASFTPAAPVAGPVSLATGVASSALRTSVPEGFKVIPGSKGIPYRGIPSYINNL